MENQQQLPAEFLTKEQITALEKQLPKEAVTQHPTKKFLSTIKPIYITERLNQVFGFGSWFTDTEIIEKKLDEKTQRPFASIRLWMTIYNHKTQQQRRFSAFGGSGNDDMGDALKGAESDAISKICAQYLHIGVSVYKGQGNFDNTSDSVASTPVKTQARKTTTTTATTTATKKKESAIDDVFGGADMGFSEVAPSVEEAKPATAPTSNGQNKKYVGEACEKCTSVQTFILEGVSSRTGKPYKGVKCKDCSHTKWLTV